MSNNWIVGMAAVLGAFMASGCVAGRDWAHAAPQGKEQLDHAMALKSNEMAEYAYETGCYQAYHHACSRMDDEMARDLCLKEGLKNCGGDAKSFRGWIEAGRK